MDDYTRESAWRSMRRVLESILEKRGKPEAIVVDNGPEFRGRALAGWSEERRVRLQFIDPGKPMQTYFIESFSGRLREECLNANWARRSPAMSQGFYRVDQGKGPHLPAPSPGPHPRSEWTNQVLLENLKAFGTYNGGRSE